MIENLCSILKHKLRSGNKSSKLIESHKQAIAAWIDKKCLKTLTEIVDRVKQEFDIEMSRSAVERCLKDLNYAIKVCDSIPVARNTVSTIRDGFEYANKFRDLELEYPTVSFTFVDEVGFSVCIRAKKAGLFIGKFS